MGCSRDDKNDCDRTRRTDLEQSTHEFIGLAAEGLSAAFNDDDAKNEATGFGAEFTSRVRANQEEKYQEKPLDNSASFRDDTPRQFSTGPLRAQAQARCGVSRIGFARSVGDHRGALSKR